MSSQTHQFHTRSTQKRKLLEKSLRISSHKPFPSTLYTWRTRLTQTNSPILICSYLFLCRYTIPDGQSVCINTANYNIPEKNPIKKPEFFFNYSLSGVVGCWCWWWGGYWGNGSGPPSPGSVNAHLSARLTQRNWWWAPGFLPHWRSDPPSTP